MATRSRAIKALDKAFSQWVRLSGADHRGMVSCWTCGKEKHWKEVDAGHFQTRAKYSIRWEPLNVKPQCKHCNMTNGGHQHLFAKRLDAVYGEGTADKLTFEGNQVRKWPLDEIVALSALYRSKVSELL
jgi:hypothetical protein